ncbi:hypothetical protein VTN77DRAFT_9587 [Rasamsonia byssochlamydoides]|uniref:uncharacterized protein n=1 Tax=Rasamsonia byssochlamydoides TaxID=89139 RepID=UPI0037441741
MEYLSIKLHLYPLGAFFLGINKTLSVPDVEYPQLDWINRHKTEEHKGNQLIQREIYLKDEVEALLLHKNGNKGGDVLLLDSEDERLLQLWEQELDQINQCYLHHQQSLRKLLDEKPRGAWIREYDTLRKRKKAWWKTGHAACKVGGGCCGRSCGCCSRPRKTSPTSSAHGGKTHCTIACGCCVRNRGFYKTDPGLKPYFEEEEKEEDEEQTKKEEKV